MVGRAPGRGGLVFRESSLLYDDAQVLVNPVNCVGVMGAGLAAAFARRWPAMLAEYQRVCVRGELVPGQLHVWHAPEGRTVINLPTKRSWRDPSRLEDVETGLQALAEWLIEHHAPSVAVPALGCGLGGLPWPQVRALIERYLRPLADEIEIAVYMPR